MTSEGEWLAPRKGRPIQCSRTVQTDRSNVTLKQSPQANKCVPNMNDADAFMCKLRRVATIDMTCHFSMRLR